MRTDLIVNKNSIESLSIDIFFGKKTLINVLYRPPSGLILPFENLLKDIFNKTKNYKKMLHIAGDFNVN